MFKEGFFTKIYNNIIDSAKTRTKIATEYYETHHILPKCLGGLDSDENLVSLTAREHFICHYLLVKIVKSERDRMKMACAFNYMCSDPIIGSFKRKKSAKFELARKMFSEHHPTKEKNVVEKISNSLKFYYNSENYQRKKEKKRKTTICKCGCGESLTYIGNVAPKFLNMSHYRFFQRNGMLNPVSEETKKICSNSAKERLLKLDDEEMKKRMQSSVWACDHVERGKKISLGKKGKKTNQQKIMGERYASMSDGEFEHFIKDKTPRIKNRMINLRNKHV